MIENVLSVMSLDSLHSFTGFSTTVIAMLMMLYFYDQNNRWP